MKNVPNLRKQSQSFKMTQYHWEFFLRKKKQVRIYAMENNPKRNIYYTLTYFFF
jgi:hypothetical protein